MPKLTITSPYVDSNTFTMGNPTPESTLKGQCHEIFCFWFFSRISFPQAPDYTIRAVSNFFENSRRYSQLKVCHRCRWRRWQMEKIFNQKNFNYFVWTPLGSRVNIYTHFCLQVFFKESAAWYFFYILPPVSTHGWQICRRGRWYQWQFATGVVDTGGKFAAGIVDTGGKFATSINNTSKTGGKICRRCRWYRWCTLTSEYLREFSKKCEMVLMGYSGAEGKLTHEKNQKQKISWHCPFKGTQA